MARSEIHLTVMAAEELKSNTSMRKMSVYTVVWIDPAMKQATRILHRGGRNPVWNDEMSFNLGENVLLYPHSTVNIQVMSQGRKKDTLIGTTHLPLAEIARMKAMKVDPEECDILQLPLTTPSGRPQGYLMLSVILIDKSRRAATGFPASSLESAAPVMGYPVGLPSSMAYYSAPPYEPSPRLLEPQGSSSGYALGASSSGQDFPLPAQPAGAVPYYPPAHVNPSSYVQPPQAYVPFMMRRAPRQRRGNLALALFGGALSGLLLGDILGVVF